MFKKVRDYIAGKIFSAEKLEYEAKLLALKQMKESASIVALAREQLSGFDPKLLDDSRNLLEQREDEESELEFLRNVHELTKNPALKQIRDFLTRNQIHHGIMEAESLQAVHFCRATINGLVLEQEVIDEYDGIYLERTKKEEEFDEYAVT